MSVCEFENAAPYKIIDQLYDTRKDFIILGLCGKIGSGVSTVSKLLEKDFDDLQLPGPGFNDPDLHAAHEYRILHTYARKNWKPFHKIRTSALITRHILSDAPSSFATLLKGLHDSASQPDAGPEQTRLEQIANDFFTRTMTVDLRAYCAEMRVSDAELQDFSAPWRLLCEDKELTALKQDAASEQQLSERFRLSGSHTDEIDFIYQPETQTCVFQNQALSKLLDAYAVCRRQKSGFQNPFWYMILREYLYDFLPRASAELWREIRRESKRLSTQALQYIGNNLRICKKPYFNKEGDTLVKDGSICLAEDINLAIKVFRACQLKLQELVLESDTREYPDRRTDEIRTIIVIDSIKNPYESMYLKARYNNYYLIGIYTEESERRKRLREDEHMVDDDINALDIIEQNSAFKREIKQYEKWRKAGENPEDCPTPYIIRKMYEQFQEHQLLDDLSFISPFILQNVSSCLDSADILINNRPDDRSYTYLKQTLLRYVCLIMNPGLVLPTAIERCMQTAMTAKLNSGCISRQVGAVVTDDAYHLLSIGWNQQPEGQLPCSYRDLCELYHHWCPEGYSDYENDDKGLLQTHIKTQVEDFFDTTDCPLRAHGKLPCYCFKDYHNQINEERNQVHTRALHAEETAFLSLGANHLRAENGILFTTSSPCELCSKKAMHLGIKTIYYVEPYAGVSEKHVLSIGERKKRPQLILFTGAIGTAYNRLYTPLLPRKDENEMWLGAKMGARLMEQIEKKRARKEPADSVKRRCVPHAHD